jgi:integrase
MATFIKRNNGWFVQIRRTGHKSISRTFDTKADAERWALSVESEMGKGTYVDNREAMSTTLAECLDRYASEIVPLKKGADREMYRVNLWRNDPLSLMAIGKIRQVDIAKWRDTRLASGISPSTVVKDLALLSHLFTISTKEWGFPVQNVVNLVRKPKIANARDRRLILGEEERILEACYPELRAFVTLAIETAMRRGELVSIQRSWIRGSVVHLPDTKNGSPRPVPLSSRALATIKSLPIRMDGKLFTYQEDAYTKGFARTCNTLGIEDLSLHDLRHEATSRLFEKGLDIMQVKAITGHKSMQMLARYTHLRADELAKLLG